MSDSESKAHESESEDEECEYPDLELFNPKCGIRRNQEHRVKDFDSLTLHQLPPYMFASDEPRRRPPVLHFGFPADMEKCEEFARQYGYMGSSDRPHEILSFVRHQANEMCEGSIKIFLARRKNRPCPIFSFCTNYSGPSMKKICLSGDIIELCEERLSTDYAGWFLDWNQFYWNPLARMFSEDM